MPRTKRAKPRQGDQPLLVPTADGTEVVSPTVIPAPSRAHKKSSRPRDAKKTAAKAKPKGKVYRWYYIVGARKVDDSGKGVWVRGASDKDALGTFRWSRYFRPDDDYPEWDGTTIGELPPGALGLRRRGRSEVIEVIGVEPDEK